MTDNSHPYYPGIDYIDTVKVRVIQTDVFDTPFWNKEQEGSLKLFQEWLAQQITTIPPEYLHAADIEIDSEGGYEGEHHAVIGIHYVRPMTPEEKSIRARLESEYEAQKRRGQDVHDRAEYARLKSKFGDLE